MYTLCVFNVYTIVYIMLNNNNNINTDVDFNVDFFKYNTFQRTSTRGNVCRYMSN